MLEINIIHLGIFLIIIIYCFITLFFNRRERKELHLQIINLIKDKEQIRSGVSDARLILYTLLEKHGELSIERILPRINNAKKALDRIWSRLKISP